MRRYAIGGLLLGLLLMAVFCSLAPREKNPPAFVSYLIYDPLLALPGVDLQRYTSAPGALRNSKDEIGQIEGFYTPDIHTEFAELMYPLRWLEALGETERLRREVITDPSHDKIEDYYEQQLVAFDTYDAYVTKLLAWYDAHPEVLLPERSGHKHYSGFTGFAYALQNLAYYQAQVAEQRQLAEVRFACYEGRQECLPVVPHPPGKVSEFVGDDYLPEIQTVLQEVRSLSSGTTPYGYEIARLGNPVCSFGAAGEYYYLWEKAVESGGAVFKLDPLADIVVRDTDAIAYDNSRYHQTYKERGGTRYEMQSLGNYYICPDIAADMTRILSSLGVMVRSKTAIVPVGMTQNLSLVDRLQDLQAAQTALATSDIVDERLTYRYIYQVWLLLFEFSEDDVVAALGKDVVRDLQEQLLLYRFGTFNFDTLMLAVVDNNEAIVSYAPYGDWNYIGDMLTMRSSHKVLLGGTNKSVITDDVLWNQEPHEGPLRESFLSYKNDLANEIPINEFAELVIQGKQVSEAMLREVLVE